MLKAQLFHLLLLGFPLCAAELPTIPASDRILSSQEVKNYWLIVLHRKPLPPKSTGLHPQKQQARQDEIVRRRKLISGIRAGSHDLGARITALEHNIAANRQLGKSNEAGRLEKELMTLREHLARIAMLEAQRELALKAALAMDRIQALEAEIARLEQQLIQAASDNNDCENASNGADCP